jgi:hypothetical protein
MHIIYNLFSVLIIIFTAEKRNLIVISHRLRTRKVTNGFSNIKLMYYIFGHQVKTT